MRGKIVNITQDFFSKCFQITLNVKDTSAQELQTISQFDDLDVILKKHKEKRSLDANAMLWACIGEIAGVLRADKWDIYLQMLKRYGKFTYICVKPQAVDAVKTQWRECEVIGNININGEDAVQILCYFGSSMYDSKEFSILLDGVIYEMRELGLQAPASSEMKRALEEWEKRNNGEK